MSDNESPHSEPGRGSVLVIDNDPQTLELMGRLLLREGFQAVIAENGAEGLRLARDELLKGTSAAPVPGYAPWAMIVG